MSRLADQLKVAKIKISQQEAELADKDRGILDKNDAILKESIAVKEKDKYLKALQEQLKQEIKEKEVIKKNYDGLNDQIRQVRIKLEGALNELVPTSLEERRSGRARKDAGKKLGTLSDVESNQGQESIRAELGKITKLVDNIHEILAEKKEPISKAPPPRDIPITKPRAMPSSSKSANYGTYLTRSQKATTFGELDDKTRNFGRSDYRTSFRSLNIEQEHQQLDDASVAVNHESKMIIQEEDSSDDDDSDDETDNAVNSTASLFQMCLAVAKKVQASDRVLRPRPRNRKISDSNQYYWQFDEKKPHGHDMQIPQPGPSRGGNSISAPTNYSSTRASEAPSPATGKYGLRGYATTKSQKPHFPDSSKQNLGSYCICGSKYGSQTKLNNHIRYYTAEKVFLCKLCPLKFNSAQTWKLHMQRCHEPKKQASSVFCLDRGGAVSGSESAASQQNFDTKWETITVSSDDDMDDNALEPIAIPIYYVSPQHVKANSTIRETPPIKSEPQPTSSCKSEHGVNANDSNFFWCLCGRMFFNKESLRSHIRYATKNWHFKCDGCDKRFLYLSVLKTHLNKVHKVKKSDPRMSGIGCGYCGRRFDTLRNLSKHRIQAHEMKSTNSTNQEK